MIGRSGMFWQTLLADLALILFIVSASTLDQDGQEVEDGPTANAAPDDEQALAVWSGGDEAEPLSGWLSTQQADPRTRLVVTVEYPSGARDAGWQAADALLSDAEEHASGARVVLQPGAQLHSRVTLQYDRKGEEVAP